MAMRTDCKHYESRTYPSGDTVRKCRLDLAPEAPWRCPDGCPSYVKRRADAGWQYGSLSEAMAPGEPEPDGLGSDAAAVLDEAEDILNAAGPDIVAEFDEPPRRRFTLGRKGGKGGRSKKRKGRRPKR
ncbi:MAG: hypothetical protein R3A49_06200 [Acidimicrobiia bacterium]